jgi:TRAP transporter TAXI family solute receptor
MQKLIKMGNGYWFVRVLLVILMVFMMTGCGVGRNEKTDTSASSPDSTSDVTEATEPSQTGAPVNIKIATLDVGSGTYAYGCLFAELIRRELPPGSSVDVLPYGGTIGCNDLVGKGEADLGLSSPFVTKWAVDGTLAFEDNKYDNLRLLITGLDTYFFAAVARKDVKFNSLKEIKDKKLKVSLATQPNRTLADFAGSLLLSAYDLSYEEIESYGGKVTHTSSEVITDNMKDGRIDLLLEYFNIGHPMLTDIATLTPIKFIPTELEIADEMCQKYSFSQVLLPAGSFPGQDEDIQLIGSSTNVIASSDMPDEIAYVITKALVENYEYLQKNMAALAEFTPEKAPKFGAGLEFHPGAVKYYVEKGLMK